jgi:transketolase
MLRRETSGAFTMANDVAGAERLTARTRLDQRSIDLRRLVVRALDGGGRGHVGSSLSLIEIMRVLYDDILDYRADDPEWPERDRCILSKGHGCIAQYVLLAEKGFFPLDVLDTFCRRDSILGGHPEIKVPGVEASTGALGHGLPVGVGRAMGLRIKGSEARVFVITGDGEINEGSVWEAALSASKHRLSNLTLLIDYNKIQSAGLVADILPLEPLADKWRAFGFGVAEVDGHNVSELRRVLNRLPLEADRPSTIICHTVKGKGFSFAENQSSWHHKSTLKKEAIAEMYSALEAL